MSNPDYNSEITKAFQMVNDYNKALRDKIVIEQLEAKVKQLEEENLQLKHTVLHLTELFKSQTSI
jgi:cell shape-determining protein MreC